MKDMTPKGFGQQAGTATESSRYYYVPDGQGGYYRERAVIACTIRGAVGPFTMHRTVTYAAWEGDAADERWDRVGWAGAGDRSRMMTPADWAERYLTAKREGSHAEATHIYADAIHDLSFRDAREFSVLIGEKN